MSQQNQGRARPATPEPLQERVSFANILLGTPLTFVSVLVTIRAVRKVHQRRTMLGPPTPNHPHIGEHDNRDGRIDANEMIFCAPTNVGIARSGACDAAIAVSTSRVQAPTTRAPGGSE